jgi:hypothetical protein
MKQIYYFGRTGGANPLASGRPVVELQHDGAHLETRAAWCRRDGGRDEKMSPDGSGNTYCAFSFPATIQFCGG